MEEKMHVRRKFWKASLMLDLGWRAGQLPPPFQNLTFDAVKGRVEELRRAAAPWLKKRCPKKTRVAEFRHPRTPWEDPQLNNLACAILLRFEGDLTTAETVLWSNRYRTHGQTGFSFLETLGNPDENPGSLEFLYPQEEDEEGLEIRHHEGFADLEKELPWKR